MVSDNAGDLPGDSWTIVTHDSFPPLSPPNAPQSLIATPVDSQVSLNWEDPANDGGSAIIKFCIYRSMTSGGPYTNIANTTELIYIDTTVSTSTPYYYVITAVNNEGESGYSIEANATLKTTTTIQSSSTTSTTSTSISISSSTTTTTTDSTPIGLLGFLFGIIVTISIRWFKKHERR